MKLLRYLSYILLYSGILKAQINVKARIDHVKPDGVDTQGNIYLTVTGGTSPYTYLWSPGGFTNKDLTNATANSYTVRVKGANNDSVFYKYNLGYKTYWTNFVSSYFRRDTILNVTTPTHSVTSTSWCTAISKNTLKNGVDGWAQWVVNSTSNYVIVGFLDSVSVARTGIATDVDFGLYQSANNLYRLANGVSYYLSSCANGDVLTIERVGNNVNYKKNQVTLASFTTAITGAWKLKSANYSTYNANIGASFLDTIKTTMYNYVEDIPMIVHAGAGSSNGAIKLTPRIGGSSHTYTWLPGSTNASSITPLSSGVYTVNIMDVDSNISSYIYNVGYRTYWTNFFGTRFRNDSLQFQSPASPTGWNTAISKNTLKSGVDGWVEFIAKAQTDVYSINFIDSASALSGTTTDVDFGVYVSTNKIYRGATLVASYRTGDVIRMERLGSTFYIKVNGNSIHSESCPSNKNFKVKAILNNISLSNIGASFLDTTNLAFENYVQDYPIIKHCSPGNSNGSMSLSPLTQGTSHNYTWTPGNSNASVIDNLGIGNYSVSIKDTDNNLSKYNYNIGYKTYWQNLYGLKFSNDSLIISSPTSPSGYNTAVSKNTLKAGTDGWFEYVVPSRTTYNKIGFIDSASVIQGYWGDVDFGFSFSTNILYRYISSGFVSVGGYKEGDVLRIERTGTNVNFKINGITVSTGTCTNSRDWKLKVSAYNGSMTNIGCSFVDTTNCNFPNFVQVKPSFIQSSGRFVSNGSIAVSPTYSNSSQTYTWSPGSEASNNIINKSYGAYTITAEDANHNKSNFVYYVSYKPYWKDFYSTRESNDTIYTATSPIGSWGTTVSKNILPANTNGFAEHVITSVSGNSQAFGFLDSAYTSGSTTDIDFGIYQSAALLYHSRNGTLTQFWHCRIGDVVRIERIGSVIHCKINAATMYTVSVPSNLMTKNWKLKVAKHNSNPTYIANIGCSFPTDFNATVDKNHAEFDNQFSGSINVTPFGGTPPYSYLWNDGDITNSKSNVSPGTYTVVISDSLNKEKVGKIVNIGVKPLWRIRNNMTATADTIFINNVDSLGRLISDNYIRNSNSGWHEVTIDNVTQDVAIGMISLPISYLDTTVTPPIYADSSMSRKSDLAYTLMRKATKDSLVYSVDNNLLQLSTDYNYIHLARIRNGQVRPLFRNTPITAVYSYGIGDILKVGRDEDGKMFLARNDTVLYKQNASNSDSFLYSAIVAKSNPLVSRGGVSGSVIIPNALNYAVLHHKLNGGYYHIKNNTLYFKYNDQYNTGTLNYGLYDEKRNLVSPCTNLIRYLGDNRFKLDLTQCSGSTSLSGFYTLEVTNEKNEKSYLKIFK